jgi:phosphomannomutase
MVTGSHIPFDRNGIKFYTPVGEILKADEQGIRSVSFVLPEAEFAGTALARLPELPVVDDRARQEYVRRYLDFFPARMLAGQRLGLYQHSGVARDLLAEVLCAFGAEVVALGRSDQFVPIDTEAVSAADQQLARDWCAAERLDALLSTDGDADRPLICGADGTMLRGDVVGILAARYLRATGVATPVSSNSALELSGWFTQVRRTRIGSPYVIDAMRELVAVTGAVVGFEANGGFLLGTNIELDGRSLSVLPTRDALLPMLALFALASERGLRLAQLPGLLPERHTASDRLQGIATDFSQRLIALMANDADWREAFFATLGKPVQVDPTDGLRVTLENGDIVHFRPSGNAPELRCYTESISQARAEALLSWGMRELGRAVRQTTTMPVEAGFQG